MISRLDLPALLRSYALKIALIAAAFAIPMLAIMFALLHQIDDLERVSSQELRAAGTIDEAMKLLRRCEDLRNAVALKIVPPGAPSLEAARADLRRGIEGFDTAPGTAFGVAADWTAFAGASRAALRDEVGENGQREGTLIAALFKFVDDVSDRSYLTYDVAVDVQSMSDAVTNGYARSIDGINLANLLAVNAGVRGRIAVTDRVALYAAKQRFATRVSSLLDDLRQSGEANPALRRRLSSVNLARFREVDSFARTLDRSVILVDSPRNTPVQFDSMAHRAQSIFEGVNAQIAPELHVIIQERMNRLRLRQVIIVASTVLAIMLGVLIAVQIIRTISKRDREELALAEERASFLSAELAREHAERALRLTEAQFRAVFKDAALGIAILDKRGKFLEKNPAFEAMLGKDPPSPLFLYHQFFDRLMDGSDEAYRVEHPLTVGYDEEKWVDASLSIVHTSDDATFVVWMLQDISERKRTEQRLVHDATHDGLTGLANRPFFEEQLEAAFREARELGRSNFAVLFVDLDHFKYINDSFGHAIGDVVLASIADRLRAAVNAGDIVARFGGDEFAILLRGVEDGFQIDSIGRRIQRNVEQPLSVAGTTVFTTASIGISIGSEEYVRPQDMLRDADTAMYNAKINGRARHITFDSIMHTRVANRVQLQSELRQAIEKRQFRLVYQPVVRIDDKSLVGCEALIRWDHPERGVVSPVEFMPFAEHIGLAIPIGRFVFRTACEQLAEWTRTRSDLDGISVNVNVSVSELFAPDFERFVVGALRETGVRGSSITLEITESAIIDREVHAADLIDRLKSHGLGICIDDFGTGYSSFRYLQQFKIDVLKIDRSFVAGEDGELASAPIVASLIGLGAAFSARVVAEGVETEQQRAALISMGAKYAQGYLFAQPVAPASLLPV